MTEIAAPFWWGKGANPPEPLCEKREPCPCAAPCKALSQIFDLFPRDRLLPPRREPRAQA